METRRVPYRRLPETILIDYVGDSPAQATGTMKPELAVNTKSARRCTAKSSSRCIAPHASLFAAVLFRSLHEPPRIYLSE